MTSEKVQPAGEFRALHTSEVEPVQQIKGGHRRVLADGERMMLVEWRFEPGASVPEHAHPHEQCGYVISGIMHFTVNGEERAVELGTGYFIPSNIPHSARFEEFTVLIDIFSPPREDYRQQSANAPSYMFGTMPPTKGTKSKRTLAKIKPPRAARKLSPRKRTPSRTSKRR
jgi:quercetin dioxygenase-like cupin family protein